MSNGIEVLPPLMSARYYKGRTGFTGEFIDHPYHFAGHGVIGHRIRHHGCIIAQPLGPIAFNPHMALIAGNLAAIAEQPGHQR